MRLQDQVSGTLSSIRSNMEKQADVNRRLGRTVQNVGRNISSVGQALMPVAGAISAAGGVGVKTFMDFEQTIVGAGVKAGATAEEMAKLKEVGAQLGATYPITATQAAEAMDRLAAGGFNANQIIGAMPGIIESAIASGEDMAVTSDVVTSALSIWNMTTGDVAANTVHVADVVQAAANASKLGMEDFGLAMQYAGAPAAALGVSIEELSTAMAIMSNNGIQASSIGTGLRAMMSRLAAPPKMAAEAIDALGLKINDAQGNFVGLTNIVDQMRVAMQGMGQTEQVAYAKAIAGEDAYSGLLALIKTAPDAYKQMEDAMNSSSGASHKAYLEMQKTLKGSIDAMISSVEAMGIAFGSALAPTIQTVASGIKSISDWFATLSPEAKSLMVDIALGIVGFTGFALAAGKLISAGGKVIEVYSLVGKVLGGGHINNKALEYTVIGFQKFGKVITSVMSGGLTGLFSSVSNGIMLVARAGMALLASPIGIAIAAIAVGAYLLYQNWDKVGPFFGQVWARISNAFNSALAIVQPAIDKLSQAWTTLTQAWANGTGIFGVIKGLFEIIANVMGIQLGVAITLVSALITGVLTTAFEVLGNIVSMGIGVFSGLIDFITGVFTGDWSLAWNGVVQIFSSIFTGLGGICQSVLDGIKAAINVVIDGINSINVDIPDWVPGVGGSNFSLNIPHLYTGTNNWGGGPAMIHDKGAEIVDLPSGARVIPHEQSMMQAYNSGKRAGANAGIGGISVFIDNANFGNGGKEEVKRVAEEILFELETRAINQNVGAV